MASTNKTANLHLNQWEASDPVIRQDFNADNAALDAAVSAKARIVTGTYTGDGSTSRTISLGGRPKAVLLMTREGFMGTTSYGPYYYGGLALDGSSCQRDGLNILSVSDAGFTVYYRSSTKINSNESNTTFHYLAVF